MMNDIDALSHRRLDIDASELRLTPGVFPETITLRGFVYHRENVRLSDDGELMAMHYTAPSSIGQLLLVVWND